MRTDRSGPDAFGRYYSRYRAQECVFRALDSALGLVVPCTRQWSQTGLRDARRILIANAGHLGDLVMCTWLIAYLKTRRSDLVIDILAGAWATRVYSNHPQVNRLHVLNHWAQNRGSLPLWKKILSYYRQKHKVVADIRKCRYDIAIDVRPWFPNFIPVLWSARIPVRLGFDRVGFGPLLTHPVKFSYDRRHEIEYQFGLLEKLGVLENRVLTETQGALPTATPDELIAVTDILRPIRGPFRICHISSSTGIRDWPIEKWRGLTKRLTAQGSWLVFTGQGPAEAAKIETVIDGIEFCINACNRLSWGGFVELIRNAELVYTVETSAAHVAAAVGTPVVGIYGGTADPRQWGPYGVHAATVTRDMSCSPCFRKAGCESMACVRDIEVDEVKVKGAELLRLRAVEPGIDTAEVRRGNVDVQP